MRLISIAIAVFCMLASSPAHGESLGRLFLTPQERAALEARRMGTPVDSPAGQTAGMVEAVALPPGGEVTLNGVVRRAGGKSTVWINGVSYQEGLLPDGVAMKQPVSSGAALTVVFTASSSGAQPLKPGQTLDQATGQVRDVYGDGQPSVEAGGKMP